MPIVTFTVKVLLPYKGGVAKFSEREAIIAKLIELVQKERLRKKLSLNEVASRAGLSHTMVMRVEKRERLPTIDTLLRIGEAVGFKLSVLLRHAEKSAKGEPTIGPWL